MLSDDYETEYEAITVRIDETYDRIYELQEQIDKKRERLTALRNGVDSTDNVRLILDNFDRLFRSMTYEERREMCRLFIQRIDVFPEEQEDGRILRQIVFKIPVYYNLPMREERTIRMMRKHGRLHGRNGSEPGRDG